MQHQGTRKIETDRLLLRQFRYDDACFKGSCNKQAWSV